MSDTACLSVAPCPGSLEAAPINLQYVALVLSAVLSSVLACNIGLMSSPASLGLQLWRRPWIERQRSSILC